MQNKLFLGCKLHLSAKRKEDNAMSEVVARRFSAKTLSGKFRKIHRKISVLERLSNNVTGLQAVGLATL